MVGSGLDDLYQEVVMDHGSNPRNMHRLNDPGSTAHGFNPFCGDIVDVDLILNLEDNDIEVISEIGFHGKGCAISLASASMMTEAVKGESVNQANKIFADFHSMVTDKSISLENYENLGDLEVLSGVANYPTRIKCALLGWHTLIAALKRDTNTVKTE
ncbi:MAG: SUF system NifU family Fe-S cluster assembly protein [SAR202 cluster bacterium]|nr:SUF system NifU family Fe-S cluster assembly protein [SAR202 cluster bacterium]|tara:strand:+ start:535 stop:1008 length:474 start_codon:yes stop_codon:yes gene_type:complete